MERYFSAEGASPQGVRISSQIANIRGRAHVSRIGEARPAPNPDIGSLRDTFTPQGRQLEAGPSPDDQFVVTDPRERAQLLDPDVNNARGISHVAAPDPERTKSAAGGQEHPLNQGDTPHALGQLSIGENSPNSRYSALHYVSFL